MKTRQEKFTEVYRGNVWKGTESVSGTGSDLAQTQRLRELLPALMKSLNATSLVDAPCGDMHWMKDISWESLNIAYTGVDIVAELIEKLRTAYPSRRFECLDLVTDILPTADAIFCRDCLVHLPLAEIRTVIRNIVKSKSAFFITTTFPATQENKDVKWSGWRPLNLQIAPFNFPAPAQLIEEGCTEGNGKFADKSLAVWRVADLVNI